VSLIPVQFVIDGNGRRDRLGRHGRPGGAPTLDRGFVDRRRHRKLIDGNGARRDRFGRRSDRSRRGGAAVLVAVALPPPLLPPLFPPLKKMSRADSTGRPLSERFIRFAWRGAGSSALI
jgi:hypothetical protein